MKKLKCSLLVLVWGIVVVQTFVNYGQKKEQEPVITAFASMGECIEEEVSGYGYLGAMELSDLVKSNMMRNLATLLEMEKPWKIQKMKQQNVETWRMNQEKGRGNLSVELVTVHEEQSQQYIMIESNQKVQDVKRDSMFQTIGHVYQEIGVDGKVTVEQIVERNGNQMKKMEEIRKSLFKPLRAKVISEINKNGICTVYGYTQKESSYFYQDGEKVNVQLVLNYDQSRNRTVIKLGIPMVNSPY